MMSRFAPICVPCRREMRCQKNDYLFSPDESAVWAGDMYECSKCKAQIVSGFAKEPVAQQHETDRFAAYAPRVQLRLTE